MKIKVLYRRNLKMSEGKLAAQTVHACLKLMRHGTWFDGDNWDGTIIVLKASDKKFQEKCTELYDNGEPYGLQEDWGLTEVEEGTQTTIAYYES